MASHRIQQYVEQELEQENDGESGEDTEEASESELGSSSNPHTVDERLEIKEQMYQDKLSNLLSQIELLKQRKHPEYLRMVERLKAELADRLLLNECYRDYLLECAARDCYLEKAAAEKEYDEKKTELKENLISDLEDRKKLIEHEFATMELSGDSIDVKPTVTRKLRRRPNEPLPVPEKRRKPTTGQVTFVLDDKEIEQDLKQIARSKPASSGRNAQQHTVNGGAGPSGSGGAGSATVSSQHGGPNADQNGSTSGGCASTSTDGRSIGQPFPPVDTRIEDGKLCFERRWFHRGQPVHVESRDFPRYAANISAIGVEVIWVKKTSDSQKVRICLAQLRRGKISIKRRAN